jgi:transcriptional regulator with XRE-family HTH domain
MSENKCIVSIKIEHVKFDGTLYPRDTFNNEVVNNYRLNIEKLPPIIVSKDLLLIDGYHRLLAYRLEGKKEIEAEVVDVPPEKVLFEAARRNSTHGLQLERSEKQKLARQFYLQKYTQEQIADVLAVSQQTISVWLSNLVKEAEAEQKIKILNAYLECKKLTEIAEFVGLSTSRVSEIISQIKSNFDFTKFSKTETPESLQYYNVWNFPKRDPRYGLETYPGVIAGQIVENILYYYTNTFDLIVDPMAGSGTTLDVCKTMARRCLAYDLKPVREDIKQHDISEGFPKECLNCDLIFLDPPYYNMVFDMFDSTEHFYSFILKLAKDSYETVKDHGFVTFLMMNQTEKLGEAQAERPVCLPHVFNCYDLFKNVGFKLVNVISAPLATQQYAGFDIEAAKERKWILGTYRDLLIFQKREAEKT